MSYLVSELLLKKTSNKVSCKSVLKLVHFSWVHSILQAVFLPVSQGSNPRNVFHVFRSRTLQGSRSYLTVKDENETACILVMPWPC